MSEVIMITSGKGGTGKTMFAANLGVALAKEGHKTIVIDCDMGMRNLDLYLGMESEAVFNVMDILTGTCKIHRAVVAVKNVPNLYFIAASPQLDEGIITDIHMQVFCEKLKTEYEYIILDMPTGLGQTIGNAASSADKAIVIIEPEVASIRGGETVDSYLEHFNIKDRYLVVNKIRPDLISQGLMPGLAESMQNFRIPLLGGIQYDDNIYVFTSKGIPIVLKSGTYIEENFINIADKIIANSIQER